MNLYNSTKFVDENVISSTKSDLIKNVAKNIRFIIKDERAKEKEIEIEQQNNENTTIVDNLTVSSERINENISTSDIKIIELKSISENKDIL